MQLNEKFKEWKNEGTEPADSYYTSGFFGKLKPPAQYFNWFWHKVIKAITEIQNGLSNVDNTSDMDKPVSTATETALAEEASIRQGADEALGDEIANTNGKMEELRINIDNTLQIQDSRIVDLESATEELRTDISAEEAARNASDTQLLGYIQEANKSIMELDTQFETQDAKLLEYVQEINRTIIALETKVDYQVIVGSYVGTGETVNNVFANLGYKPKKVEIVPATQGNYSTAVLIRDCPYSAIMRSSNQAYGISLSWTDSGVTLTPSEPEGNTNAPTVICNVEGTTYYYAITK